MATPSVHIVHPRSPLTFLEACAYLNVSERWLRRAVAERRLPYFKVGRLLRFDRADLDGLLDAGRVEAAR